MWDEEDGFFYDLLRLPDGSADPAAGALDGRPAAAGRRHRVRARGDRALSRSCSTSAAGLHRPAPERDARCCPPGGSAASAGDHLLALFDEPRLRRILARLLDEDEFLSPYGIRSLSRHHADHPFELRRRRPAVRASPYLPAESDSGMFGGNSNWRGPIWFPINALIIRALLNLYVGYGDEFTVECPTGSGVRMTLFEVAREISDRLTRIFLPDADGRRPCYGGQHDLRRRRALARPGHVLRVLPRRQRRRPRRQPPDRLDRAGRGVPEPVRRPDRRRTCWTDGMAGVLPHDGRDGGAANDRLAVRAGRSTRSTPGRGWPSCGGGSAGGRRSATCPPRSGTTVAPPGAGRGVADGGVGTQPGRAGDRPAERGAAAGVPRRAAGPGARGRGRVAVLRAPLRRRRAAGRPGRAGGGPGRAGAGAACG